MYFFCFISVDRGVVEMAQKSYWTVMVDDQPFLRSIGFTPAGTLFDDSTLGYFVHHG